MHTGSTHVSLTESGVANRAARTSRWRWHAWTVWLACMVVLTFASQLPAENLVDFFAIHGPVIGLALLATLGAMTVSGRGSAVLGWTLILAPAFWSIGLLSTRFLRDPSFARADRLTEAQVLIGVSDASIGLGAHALLALVVLMPYGRVPTRRWRGLLWLLAGSALFWTAAAVVGAPMVVDPEAWLGRSTPVSTSGINPTPTLAALLEVGFVIGASVTVSIGVSLVKRLRRATGEERARIRWVVLGCMGIVAWLLLWLPYPAPSWLIGLQRLAPGIGLVTFATGLAVSLFRYQIWGIDLLARRAITYSLLCVAIAGLYVAIAIGIGQAAGSALPLGVAVTLTAFAASASQPLRQWMEASAERWVFGPKVSPVVALHTLGQGLANSHRASEICVELASAVDLAVRPAWVSVETATGDTAQIGRSNDEPKTVVDLEWRGEVLGLVICQPHPNEEFSVQDLTLLETLAAQAAFALSHLQLARRIIDRQDREGQAIHGGAQQDLTGSRDSFMRGDLSDREIEVLAEMAQGKSNSAIAQTLYLSESAVEKHVGSIMRKFHLDGGDPTLNRRVAAVLEFVRRYPSAEEGRASR